MTKPVLPYEGGCRCDRLRFKISQPPMMSAACHCTGCQRMTGSAFSLTVMVPADGFEVTAGDPVIGGLHGKEASHFHCDYCKSWVFTRAAFDDSFVNVRTTMLDNPIGFDPYIETFTSEKLPWAVTSARHSYPKFPEMADFGGLIAEYQGS